MPYLYINGLTIFKKSTGQGRATDEVLSPILSRFQGYYTYELEISYKVVQYTQVENMVRE